MDQWLLDIIDEIENSSDLSEIKSVLVKISGHLGFSNVAYAVKLPSTFTRSSALIISDFPSEWLQRYSEQGYVNIDPVVTHCFSSQIAYPWERFKEHSKGAKHGFIGEAGEFGLRDGISIGMPRFDGKIGVISLASDQHLAFNPEQHRRNTIYLNALQPFIHERICQLTEKAQQSDINVHLTEREETCLVWVAEGKTAHDIAAILSVSEATVVFHLKNSIQKLNVTNRSQAIAKAILLGLITPQFPRTSVPTYHF